MLMSVLAGRLACLSVLVVALTPLACDDDGGVTAASRVPLAFTRFVHAVADTSATDWRFTDQLENSPVAFGLTFRGFTPYQATAPGNRRLRVFTTSTNIDITSRFLIDSVLSFDEGAYYTIVHLGYARPGQLPADQIVILNDEMPAVAAGSIAIRAAHLGAGLGSLDVFADTLGGTSPLPASPLFAGLSLSSAASYALRDTGRLALRVTNAGQTSPVVISAVVPAGEAGDPSRNLTTIGGSRMAGSAISALVVPRSVAGSPAPQALAFQAPALVFLIDKHPR